VLRENVYGNVFQGNHLETGFAWVTIQTSHLATRKLNHLGLDSSLVVMNPLASMVSQEPINHSVAAALPEVTDVKRVGRWWQSIVSELYISHRRSRSPRMNCRQTGWRFLPSAARPKNPDDNAIPRSSAARDATMLNP